MPCRAALCRARLTSSAPVGIYGGAAAFRFAQRDYHDDASFPVNRTTVQKLGDEAEIVHSASIERKASRYATEETAATTTTTTTEVVVVVMGDTAGKEERVGRRLPRPRPCSVLRREGAREWLVPHTQST